MINSIVVYTEEIDDLELAVEELTAQTKDFEFKKNSVAILFGDEDLEYDELYSMLKEKWNIPFVGSTAMAMLTDNQGYCKSGISVMIMTSDESKFSVGMTETIDINNYKEEIKNTYERLEQELDGEEVKLVLTYGAKISEIVGDEIIDAVEEVNKNVKIYGALASDTFTFESYRVFCNDREGNAAQVFVLITGEINPKVISVNSISGKANFSYEVTESEGNCIYRLGNDTFLDVLDKVGMSSDKVEVLNDYIHSPFIISVDKPNGANIEVLRSLLVLDHEKKSGGFLGGIPKDCTLEVGLINVDGVKNSVQKAFEELNEWLKEDGKNCTTILCSSCAGRFLALGNNVKAEAESYQGILPKDISLMGMYSFGEYCPMGEENWCNVFHNSTFTILCI